ncbi:PA2169 family four-helix-bundle protein [Stieleria maiorica]|nr:PA2169 family four-helix-bundle protein [Stieleria maiorica]
MSVDTNPPLTDEMVQRLQDLIQANIDSAEGYNDAAAHLGDSELSDHVVQLNRQRLKFASELQTFVQVGGVRPVKDGSWLAKLHGSWLDLKANLIGRDIAEILRDIRHVEKMLENAYDETLALMTPATSTELADRLRQHLDSIRRERERISGQPPHERLDDESS